MGTNDVPLYNPNDGLYGRGGGPYLDEEQAREAEIRRARVEGREPDLENPGAYAGIQLQTAAQMIANRSLDVNRVGVSGVMEPGEDVFEKSAKSKDTALKVQDKIPAAAFDPKGLGKKAAESREGVVNPTDPNAAADDQMVFNFDDKDGEAAGADAKKAEDKVAADKAKADAKKSTSSSSTTKSSTSTK